MQRIKVNLGPLSYDICIGNRILEEIGDEVKSLNLPRQGRGLTNRALIVTNAKIGSFYADIVKDSLTSAGFEVKITTVPDGEEYKSVEEAVILYKKLLDWKMDRRSCLLSLSGGVIGDLAGFVAATFLRGIPYVQIPTSLLAQVDSSVGGKTAVNLPEGKNLIGAFYQPRLVWIDVDTLKTLPQKELEAGLAEVIKYGVIRDEEFFKYLESNIEGVVAGKEAQPEILEKLVTHSCRIKAEVVEKDEKEEALRAILNYGHTIGHAIEAASGYDVYKHGEAVSMGMVCAAKIAERMGLLNNESVERQVKLLKAANLPTELPPLAIKDILKHMEVDKKVLAGKVRFVLPEKIGRVKLCDDVPPDLVKKVLKEQGAER